MVTETNQNLRSKPLIFLLCFSVKVFAETKDELALVLFGTDSTKNPLEQDGQYQNIVVHRHLMVPDFELLEEIEHQIHPENQQADCILFYTTVYVPLYLVLIAVQT